MVRRMILVLLAVKLLAEPLLGLRVDELPVWAVH